MKHKRACIVMLLIVFLPIQGGQPTRSHHMRNQSMSIAELSEKYHVEIKQISNNEMPSMEFGFNFRRPLAHHRSAKDFSAIQEEIANEVARRSPEERDLYLQSIAALINVYPEWLDVLNHKDEMLKWYEESI